MKDDLKKNGFYGSAYETGKTAIAHSYHIVNECVMGSTYYHVSSIQAAIEKLHSIGIAKSRIDVAANLNPYVGSIVKDSRTERHFK